MIVADALTIPRSAQLGAATVLRRLQGQKQPRLTRQVAGVFLLGGWREPKVRAVVLVDKRPRPEGRHKPLGALLPVRAAFVLLGETPGPAVLRAEISDRSRSNR